MAKGPHLSLVARVVDSELETSGGKAGTFLTVIGDATSGLVVDVISSTNKEGTAVTFG